MRQLFFDLDGTLIDPRAGFVASLSHALRELSVPVPPADALARYIGPPLEQTLRELLGAGGDVPRAIALYDQRYAAQGIFESTLYPGVAAGLAELSSAGFTLRVLTSKRHDFALEVVAHHGLSSFVSEVRGFERSGSTGDKGSLLKSALEGAAIAPGDCWMIGDRSFDVLAARQNGVRAIGVAWGYGSRNELVQAGAEVVVGDMAELVSVLRALGADAPM